MAAPHHLVTLGRWCSLSFDLASAHGWAAGSSSLERCAQFVGLISDPVPCTPSGRRPARHWAAVGSALGMS